MEREREKDKIKTSDLYDDSNCNTLYTAQLITA